MKLVDKDGNKVNLQPGDKIVYNFSRCRIQFMRGKSSLYIEPDGSGVAGKLDGLIFEISTHERFLKQAQIIATVAGLELKSHGGGPRGWECQFG